MEKFEDETKDSVSGADRVTRSKGSGLEAMVSDLTLSVANQARDIGQLSSMMGSILARLPSPPPSSPGDAGVDEPVPSLDAVPLEHIERGYRPQRFFPPPLLEKTATIGDFRIWRMAWTSYARSSKLVLQPLVDQRTQLFQAISLPFQRLLEFRMSLDPFTGIGIEETLDSIHTHIRKSRSVLLDRVKFFRRQRRPEETIADFLADLKQLDLDADMGNISHDDLFISVALILMDHQRLLNLFLARPKSTFEDSCAFLIEQDQVLRDSAEVNSSTLPSMDPPLVCAVDVPRAFLPVPRISYGRGRPYPARRQASRGPAPQAPVSRGTAPCSDCNFLVHTYGTCPAAKSRCQRCGQNGHFTRCCSRQVGSPPESSAPSINSIFVGSVSSLKDVESPTVFLECLDPSSHASLGFAVAIPDSGAACSVAPPSWLKSLHPTPALRQVERSLVAAGGSSLNVLGAVDVVLGLGEFCSEPETVYVCSGVARFLLSLRACHSLCILPSHFPNPPPALSSVSSQTTSTDVIAVVTAIAGVPSSAMDILSSLESTAWPDAPSSDVLKRIECQIRDMLGQCRDASPTLPVMSGAPMRIALEEGAVPFRLTNPRPIPVCQRDETKRILAKMVSDDIVEPAGSEPSSWCHPAVIVPKGTDGLRFCIDFTRLNKFVRRPYHPFQTPRDAVVALPSGANFFSTFDAESGYWQLALDEQKKYREAADAAFTFHVKNPTNEMMLSNVHYYLDSPGVNKEEVVNLDKLSYTKLFMDGAQYYRDENYKMMIENMEQVIPLYLKHEEDCRFECEKPFDMGWFPDFITSIANHFTFCLRCKLRCISKLENLDGEVVEGLFPLLYHYLQMGYYKGGDVENAVKCVETYRLFHPNDADMNQNLEFYRDVEEAKAEWFEARHEAVAYLKRLTYEQSLLVRIEDTFAEFQPREESKALEQGISVEVDEFRPLPPPIPKFEL